MTTTRIIALCACVTLTAALPARASAQVQRSTPQLPDEYKMKAEKEAEARKKALAEKAEQKADPPKSAEADKAADAGKKTDAAKTDAAARAERAEAARKAEAERKAVAEQRKADFRAAEARKAEERRAAQAAKAEADKQRAADKKAEEDAKKATEAERRAARQQEIIERARARKAADEEKQKAAAEEREANEANRKISAEKAAAEKAAVEKAAAADRAAAAERAAAQKAAADKAAADRAAAQKSTTPVPAAPQTAPRATSTQPAATQRVSAPPVAAQPAPAQPAAAQTASPRATGGQKESAPQTAAPKPSVDEKVPPAVIPAERQPDGWRMQQEKDREKKPSAEGIKPTDRPDAWKTERERAREGGGQASSGQATGKPAGGGATASQKRAEVAKSKRPWRGWSDRAIVSVNGGWQSSSFDLRDTENFAPSIQGDREQRTMSADYAVEPGVSLDLSGIVRAWKGLGVGVAVTRFRDARNVPVSGSIPHPFFFNQARAVTGTTAGLRQEMAVHLDAVWVIPAGRKLQIGLFAGPSFYSVKQTVVRDFTFSEQYPYDEATLTSLTANDESSSVTGFNVGTDIGYYFTNTIGVGGVLRLGRGKVETSLGSLDVGGPEFGFGLRLRIPQGRNTARPTTPQPPKTTPQPAPRPKE